MFFNNKKNRKSGFTLAEVLITLSIIGVVAVMTIPALQTHYNRQMAETRLKSFYSKMSQAHGLWLSDEHMDPKDVSYRDVITSAQLMAWWQNNLGRHFKASTVQTILNAGNHFPSIRITLLDGSAANVYINHPGEEGAAMHFFYCVDSRFCTEHLRNDTDGIHAFLFTLHQGKKGGDFVTSYDEFHEKNRAELLANCSLPDVSRRHGCARLIEVDNWKIRSDYPWFH